MRILLVRICYNFVLFKKNIERKNFEKIIKTYYIKLLKNNNKIVLQRKIIIQEKNKIAKKKFN